MSLKRGYLFALSLLLASPAIAQTNIALEGFSADATAPVEIASESLTVNRESGSAVFTGDVVNTSITHQECFLSALPS